MSYGRIFAREWLWFIGVLVPTFALTIATGVDFEWYSLAFFYIPICVVRLTAWSIRTLRSATQK